MEERYNFKIDAEKYLPLVRKIAGRISGRIPAGAIVDCKDLTNLGVIGLMFAIRKFKPSKNVPFEKFAPCRIRGYILDSLREMDYLSRYARNKRKLLERGENNLAQKIQRKPTGKELIAYLKEEGYNIREKDLVKIEIYPDELDFSEDLPDLITSPGGMDDPFRVLLRRECVRMLNVLPYDLKEVMCLYFFEKKTLKEIGRLFNQTKSWIGQQKTRAIETIRDYFHIQVENGSNGDGAKQIK